MMMLPGAASLRAFSMNWVKTCAKYDARLLTDQLFSGCELRYTALDKHTMSSRTVAVTVEKNDVREHETKHVVDFLRGEVPILLVDRLERDAELM